MKQNTEEFSQDEKRYLYLKPRFEELSEELKNAKFNKEVAKSLAGDNWIKDKEFEITSKICRDIENILWTEGTEKELRDVKQKIDIKRVLALDEIIEQKKIALKEEIKNKLLEETAKLKAEELTNFVWYGSQDNKKSDFEFIYNPILPAEGLFLIGGDSESFKSLNLIYQAMCLASGKSWFDCVAKKRYKVFYFDFENGKARTEMRIEAIKKGNGFTDEDLKDYFVYKSDKGFTIDLSNNSDKNSEWSKIKQFILDNKIDIVMFDGLMHPFNESELLSNNIRKIYKLLAPLMLQGVNFIGVVEDNKSTNQYTDAHDTIKGSKTQVFKMDSGLHILRQDENRVLLKNIKNRDGTKDNTMEVSLDFENDSKTGLLDSIKFSLVRKFDSTDKKALIVDCSNKLLEVIKSLGDNEFDFGDKAKVYATIKKKSFTRSIIYSARDNLIEVGKIRFIKKGRYALI